MLTGRFRQSWLWPFLLLSILPTAWLFVAIANGYVLEGDNAQIAIRTHDVFSKNPPLLGMPSTAGNEVSGANAFHPGPVQFLFLTPFYALSGFNTWGILVGSLALNLGLVAIGFWAAWRTGFRIVKRATVAIFTVLVVFLQGFHYTPWNPFPVAIGVASLSILLWASAIGVRGLLPAIALVASFVAQGHLVGGIFVALGLVLAVLVGAKFGSGRRPPVREVATASLILILCWIFPLWQMIVDWPGNAGAIAAYVVGKKVADDHTDPVMKTIFLIEFLIILVILAAGSWGARASFRGLARKVKSISPMIKELLGWAYSSLPQ